jgi:hypothetical protein
MNNTSWMKIAIILAVSTLVLGITTAFFYMENVAYYRKTVELEQSYEDLEQLASHLMFYVYSEDGRVAVGYPLGFQEYANSILEICETAIDQYYIIFGMECPDIQVFITTNAPQVSWGIIAGYRIYFSVGSIDDLAPSSGYIWVYWSVSDVANAVFSTDNGNFSAGWRFYSGCKIVSEIYRVLGDEAWPIPYNYSETEGEARLLKQINDPSLCKPGTSVAAAKILYTIEGRYGSRVFSQALNNVEPSYTEDRYHFPFYRLEDFKNALIDVTGDPSILDLFSEYRF